MLTNDSRAWSEGIAFLDQEVPGTLLDSQKENSGHVDKAKRQYIACASRYFGHVPRNSGEALLPESLKFRLGFGSWASLPVTFPA